jgi:hypothetical protein
MFGAICGFCARTEMTLTGHADVAPKFAFDSELQSLNQKYKSLLEPLKVRS